MDKYDIFNKFFIYVPLDSRRPELEGSYQCIYPLCRKASFKNQRTARNHLQITIHHNYKFYCNADPRCFQGYDSHEMRDKHEKEFHTDIDPTNTRDEHFHRYDDNALSYAKNEGYIVYHNDIANCALCHDPSGQDCVDMEIEEHFRRHHQKLIPKVYFAPSAARLVKEPSCESKPGDDDLSDSRNVSDNDSMTSNTASRGKGALRSNNKSLQKTRRRRQARGNHSRLG